MADGIWIAGQRQRAVLALCIEKSVYIVLFLAIYVKVRFSVINCEGGLANYTFCVRMNGVSLLV